MLQSATNSIVDSYYLVMSAGAVIAIPRVLLPLTNCCHLLPPHTVHINRGQGWRWIIIAPRPVIRPEHLLHFIEFYWILLIYKEQAELVLACNCRVQELQLRQSGPGTTAASRVNITRPSGPGVAETERRKKWDLFKEWGIFATDRQTLWITEDVQLSKCIFSWTWQHSASWTASQINKR